MTTHESPRGEHIRGPLEPILPGLEVDENIAFRPEEEVADLLRAEPGVEHHTRNHE